METCRSNTVRRWALTLLLTSLAPIPFATIANREAGHMGHNYFKSLFAVGFQGDAYHGLHGDLCCSGAGYRGGRRHDGAIWTCVG